MFVSALGAIVGGDDNRLKLPRVNSSLVVLIDGLGYLNLKEHAGHARILSRLLANSGDRAIRCGFPSTTAVSLTSLGTGLTAGTHGVLGYQLLGNDGAVRNMLNGWRPDEDPRQWQPNQTISERATANGLTSTMIAAKEYKGSGFTNVIMGDIRFEGVDDISERTKTANRLTNSRGQLNYLYFAELDQAAHRHGVGSPNWLNALEQIDQSLSALTGPFGILITGDHGVKNVDAVDHIYLDLIPGFSEAVSFAVGDPRALFCYGDFQSAKVALETSGVDGFVATFTELAELGWVSGQQTRDLVPDFVLVAKGKTAFYDRRTAKVQSLKMIGQHGGVDDVETRVPLIRAGLFI